MTGGPERRLLKTRKHPPHRPFPRGFDDPAGEHSHRKADRRPGRDFRPGHFQRRNRRPDYLERLCVLPQA
jgi:hypothetical protein